MTSARRNFETTIVRTTQCWADSSGQRDCRFGRVTLSLKAKALIAPRRPVGRIMSPDLLPSAYEKGSLVGGRGFERGQVQIRLDLAQKGKKAAVYNYKKLERSCACGLWDLFDFGPAANVPARRCMTGCSVSIHATCCIPQQPFDLALGLCNRKCPPELLNNRTSRLEVGTCLMFTVSGAGRCWSLMQALRQPSGGHQSELTHQPVRTLKSSIRSELRYVHR
jgi:hypothetical protein